MILGVTKESDSAIVDVGEDVRDSEIRNFQPMDIRASRGSMKK